MDTKSASDAVELPLVILPGLMCDSRMFSAQLDSSPSAAVVDGFYGGANQLEGMADYALARMPDRAALLGHSMGARVALEIWRKAPGRVERLALADTGAHPVRPGEADKRNALRDIGREKGIHALLDSWLLPMLAPSRQGDAALVASLRAMCADAGLATYEAQIRALLSRQPVDDLLPAIDCPVFLIVGSEDAWSPVEQHREIAAAIPHAQLRVIEGAGHMAPAEDPDAFNLILREWLQWPAACHTPQPLVPMERH